MAEPQAPLKTYRGNCHCAAYVYEITLPEIKQGIECNCSSCYKRAAIWVFPDNNDIKYVKGDPATLTGYSFNQNKYIHSFCPTCGVSVQVSGNKTPPRPGKLPETGINVRTLQHGQVDVWKLDVKRFNGRALPPAYNAPKFTGSQPTGDVEAGKLYIGGCHCGAVTLAMKAKPISKDSQGPTECNCSICGKYGATWTYQHNAQVAIEGRENVGQYYFNRNVASKLFCKTCGIPIGSEAVQFTDEKVARMNEMTRKWYEANRYNTSVNLRLFFYDLDVNELAPQRFDGYNIIQPAYVKP
ncbi:glutathione-dependent formaldehyde-activating enzyme [Xylaria nigripes]|nr:glutathione-dependent formaldehyde-activating enzyme [Xylaria nigripes]